MNIARSLASALALSLYGANTFAQPPVLEEVIVTATKRAESLQDIPVTVNAVTADTLQDAGVVDLADVAQLVPSLTTTTTLSPLPWRLRSPSWWTGSTWDAPAWVCQT